MKKRAGVQRAPRREPLAVMSYAAYAIVGVVIRRAALPAMLLLQALILVVLVLRHVRKRPPIFDCEKRR